ncbi:response regulator transcription factor [Brevibacillus laterosporus]|uniref:DNA-binding response regulator n=1 Tax=Brevibacillus laterosporus TaxID=1465 RepID=A0AAP3DGA1_BRELA|nr:response regulator transcription factor [Brevibacillus laterosporus]MCR8980156.1 response regulator transcription factor [Brevibacillus laterosporus]MCZ0807311.1 response regulator transcription factor [Brevibacillus laterosporus]MCZ0825580.1 response regulator transcription factor [Brevibacillus laterosporus]MCZ0849358.1 response regulator transcription factor [Brevibacillus laterosporus]PPB10734.1 DNA-binding response regulator [Brevibacillus laterosporus]
MNILLADDDLDMLRIIRLYFEKEGFKTFTAQDGEEALAVFYNQKIDLAVLDWMMPKISGLEVCKEIKGHHTAKVLMLTAKGEHEDELMALEVGADEYVRKPFEPRILIVRAKKLLQIEDSIRIGPLRVDMQGGKIFKDGIDLEATKKEFQLMKCFLTNRGRILSRKTLLDQVWGFDYYGEERTVDTHIRRLREKIGEQLIKTHRGVGYSLEVGHE